jgi:hypothetical protein
MRDVVISSAWENCELLELRTDEWVARASRVLAEASGVHGLF